MTRFALPPVRLSFFCNAPLPAWPFAGIEKSIKRSPGLLLLNIPCPILIRALARSYLLLCVPGLIFAAGQVAAHTVNEVSADTEGCTFHNNNNKSRNINPASLMRALEQLSAEGGYRLVTSPDLVEGRQVSIPTACERFEVRARQLLAPHGLAFSIIDGTLVVFREAQRTSTGGAAVQPTPPTAQLSEVRVEGRRYRPGDTLSEDGRYGSYAGGADAVVALQDIQHLGITDLASALALVSGVKMEQQRYAVIRGMSGRYQSVRLNGAAIPSLDPSSERVPLDIFPVHILNQVDLHKSVFADAPGSASAGVLNIETRRIPEQNQLTLVTGGAYRSGTSGEAVLRGHVGAQDWLGVDDGGRDLPAVIADSAHLGHPDVWPEGPRKAAGEAIPTDYALRTGNAGADTLAHISGGRAWRAGQHRWGLSGALGYQTDWQQLAVESSVLQRRSTVRQDMGQGGETGADTLYASEASRHRRLDHTVNVSGLLALGYGFDERQHVGANLLLLRQSTDHSQQILSEAFSANGSTLGNGEETLRSLFNWTERQMALGQLYGSHTLGADDELGANWHLTSAHSDYQRPYDVSYRYHRQQNGSYRFETGSEGFGVGWEAMEEEALSAGFSLATSWSLGADWSGEVKWGLDALRARQDGYLLDYTFIAKGDIDADQVLMEQNDPAQILTPDNIVGLPGEDGFLLDNVSDLGLTPPALDGGFYASEHRNRAGYLLADFHFRHRWQWLLGARHERDRVRADFWDAAPEAWVPLLDERTDLFSTALRYSPSDSQQWHLGYSETAVWPGVNELMPRRYEDVELRIQMTGNPNLEAAWAENWDLRWQWQDEERGVRAKLLGFYKSIDSAIEGVFFDPVISSDRTFNVFTYVNTEAATLYGYELELDWRRLWAEAHELSVKSSFARLDSEVDIPAEVGRESGERAMQGQPEYLGSVQLRYQHLHSGQRLSLTYQQSGGELYIVSNTFDVPSVYRRPRGTLSLAYNRPLLADASIAFAVENLLDDDHHYQQGGQTFLRYQQGRRYELRFSYDF